MEFIQDIYAYAKDMIALSQSYLLGRLTFALFATWCVWIAYTSQKHHLSWLGYVALAAVVLLPWYGVLFHSPANALN